METDERTAEEEKWRIDDDAWTLSRAAEIQRDPDRMKAAKARLRELVKEEEEKLKAMQDLIDSDDSV